MSSTCVVTCLLAPSLAPLAPPHLPWPGLFHLFSQLEINIHSNPARRSLVLASIANDQATLRLSLSGFIFWLYHSGSGSSCVSISAAAFASPRKSRLLSGLVLLCQLAKCVFLSGCCRRYEKIDRVLYSRRLISNCR